MNRALNPQEQEKVRTARGNFFKILKRKDSTAQTSQPETKTVTSTTQPYSESSSKRFKLPDMSPSKSSDPGSDIPLIIRFYDPETPPDQAKDARNRTLEEILSWSDSQLERCHNYIQMLFPLPEGSPFNWEAPVITRKVMLEFRSRRELRDSLRTSFERMLEFYGFTVSTKPEEDEEKEAEKAKESGSAGEVNASMDQHETGSEQAAQTGSATDKMSKEDGQNPVVPATSEFQTPATDTEAAIVADADALNKKPDEATTETSSSHSSNPEAQVSSSAGYYVVRAPHWRKSFRNWAVRFDHNHLRITRILRCLRVLGLETECEAFYTALKNVFDDPDIHINQRSMIYWQRAVRRPLYIAPDDDRCGWLKKWEEEQPVKEGTNEMEINSE
ncbi:Nn.00g007980.m01.CDS01 [Neocucurbitaria sp. VM-36]